MRGLALAAVFCLAACGKEEPPGVAEPSAPAPRAATEKPAPKIEKPAAAPVADPGKTGIVSGRVNVEGTVRMRKLRIAEPKCAAKHPTPPFSDVIVVDKDNNVRYAFVYVKAGVKGEFPAPAEPRVLNQIGCIYTPHVIGIQPGQPLNIKSSDAVLHNVHGLGFENVEFNRGMPGIGQITRKFRRKEIMYRIKCDVHSWMGAWVGILDHPFYAVSAADGTYAIQGLPPGAYTIEVWHEKYKSLTAEVNVAAGKTETVDFTLKDKKG